MAEGGYLKIMSFHSNIEHSGNETQIGDKRAMKRPIFFAFALVALWHPYTAVNSSPRKPDGLCGWIPERGSRWIRRWTGADSHGDAEIEGTEKQKSGHGTLLRGAMP